MKQKKVVLLIAHDGYQQVEYGVTLEILASENIHVITASDEAGVAFAKDSSSTNVDITVQQILPMEIDGLFLIGGPGALTCLDTEPVHQLLQNMMALNKPYGAICIATRILAFAQVLGGKKATGWNEDHELEALYKRSAATYVHEPVVIDHNLVTATGPEAAQAFAQAILKVLAQ